MAVSYILDQRTQGDDKTSLPPTEAEALESSPCSRLFQATSFFFKLFSYNFSLHLIRALQRGQGTPGDFQDPFRGLQSQNCFHTNTMTFCVFMLIHS